jgi:predicted metal-dependent phosphoesterase TrpH
LPRADLHLHTTYSAWRQLRFIHPRDCYVPPVGAYRAALAAGMDFVAVTDHDSVEGALRLLEHPEADPARVIVGEEVEATFPEIGQWVHVNVLGITEEDHRELQRLRPDVRELCAYCRERDLLHVLNHPFQSYTGQKPLESYLEDILSLFTHVEGLNGGVTASQNRAVSALCEEADLWGGHLVQVGGSDAHTLGRVGRAWTEAEGGTAGEFLAQVKAGRCRVGGTAQSFWGLVGSVHSIIGTYYLRLFTGRGEAQGAASYCKDAAVATALLPFAFGPFPAAVTALHQARQKAVARSVLARLEKPLALCPAPYGASRGPRAGMEAYGGGLSASGLPFLAECEPKAASGEARG